MQCTRSIQLLFVDAGHGENTVEAGVETHDPVHPVTLHHGNVNGITRGQLAFAEHQVTGALNVRELDYVNGFYEG